MPATRAAARAAASITHTLDAGRVNGFHVQNARQLAESNDRRGVVEGEREQKPTETQKTRRRVGEHRHSLATSQTAAIQRAAAFTDQADHPIHRLEPKLIPT